MGSFHSKLKDYNYKIGVVIVLFSSFVLFSFQNCNQGFQTDPLVFSSKGELSVSEQGALLFEFSEDPNGKLLNSKDISIPFQFTTKKIPDGAVFECSTDIDPKFSGPCKSPFKFSNLSDGSHFLKIHVVEKSGQITPEIATSFIVDTTPPILNLNSYPTGVVGSIQATVAFSATDNVSGLAYYECSLDSSAFSKCDSPMSLKNLSQGSHSFSVRSVDNAKNISDAKIISWMVQTGVPTVTIVAPATTTKLTSASITFSGKDSAGNPLSSFKCSLDTSSFVNCKSPYSISNLKDGIHKVNVVGTDAAGISSSPQSVSWLVDLIPPSLNFSSFPSTPTTSTSALFVFTVNDTGTSPSGVKSVQCKLDTGLYSACNGRVSYSGLVVGSHSLTIQATDNAGNTQTFPTFSWTIQSAPATTGSIALAWDPNTQTQLAKYQIHYGTASGSYLYSVPVDKSLTTVTLPGLKLGVTYYFAATSVDANGVESTYSNEASGMPK